MTPPVTALRAVSPPRGGPRALGRPGGAPYGSVYDVLTVVKNSAA